MTSALPYELSQARIQDFHRDAARTHRVSRQRRVVLRLPSMPRLRRSRRALPV
jgi:hypothetical protein